MDHVISEPCYKETILQRNYRKITIKWPFSCNFLCKIQWQKYGSHNMTFLYNKVCNKGTAL